MRVSSLAIGLMLQITVAAHQPTATRTPTPVIETYRVVLKDGTQYVTREPYHAQGKLAVFTLSTGQVVSIPLASVDQQITRTANLQLRRPVPTATAVRNRGVRIVMVGTPGPTLPASKISDDSVAGSLRFSGRGHEATNLFSLNSGLYVFRLHHTGESNFIVHLVSESGQSIDYLVNQIGDFDGSKAVRIERSGKYLLNIDADGDWSVSGARPD